MLIRWRFVSKNRKCDKEIHKRFEHLQASFDHIIEPH